MQVIDYTNYKTPSDYFKFEQGDNRLKIISKGLMALFHGLKTANKYVPLGLCSESGDCEHCGKGNEPKRVWRWIVCDVTGEAKVLDAGKMIGDQICQIAIKQGDPQEYELIVHRTGVGRQTKYVVTKSPDMKIKPMSNAITMKNYLVKKYFSLKEKN